MPYIGDGDALDCAFVNLSSVAAENGPPPWRARLIGKSALRAVLLHWHAGYATVPHIHPASEELFIVIDGEASFTIGEVARHVGPGDLMFAGRGVNHAIRVGESGPLTLLAIVAPNEDRLDETIEANDG